MRWIEIIEQGATPPKNEKQRRYSEDRDARDDLEDARQRKRHADAAERDAIAALRSMKETSSPTAAKRRKLRAAIDAAQRQKASAARRYQDAVRTANDTIAAKRSELSRLIHEQEKFGDSASGSYNGLNTEIGTKG